MINGVRHPGEMLGFVVHGIMLDDSVQINQSTQVLFPIFVFGVSQGVLLIVSVLFCSLP